MMTGFITNECVVRQPAVFAQAGDAIDEGEEEMTEASPAPIRVVNREAQFKGVIRKLNQCGKEYRTDRCPGCHAPPGQRSDYQFGVFITPQHTTQLLHEHTTQS